MDNKNFAFGKINFILIAISMAIVIIGLVMMTGASSDSTAFDKEIFSATRISIAPIVCLFGFVSIIFGIMYRKPDADNNAENIKEEQD